MGETTDPAQLISDLNAALPLMARDVVASAVAAGTLNGPEGVALAERLREFAADELRDVERVAGRVATLGGTPNVGFEVVAPDPEWRKGVEALLAMQRETLDTIVAAIPADADDAEGEATEHLLEHLIARKRDAIEMLERAVR